MSLSFAMFGKFRLFTIETGQFQLDGGSMFGVVPKTLWSRHFESDDKNRILMAARSLLVHSTETGRAYLIDTGMGHKFDRKFSEIYSIDFSEFSLEQSLAYHGFVASDITDVIFTHMHFDHCGGAVAKQSGEAGSIHSGGELHLTFSGARHWIHRDHWDNVKNPNEREASSFLPDNIQPLEKSGMLELVDDDHVYEPGFSIITVNGHTPGQQLPLLSDGGRHLMFAADLIPTAAHLPLSWIMGFDTRPLVTVDEKKRVLSRCLSDGVLLYLQHDPYHELIQIGGRPGRPSVEWSGTLDDL